MAGGFQVSRYRLNGEVDKRNHPYFREIGWLKPDLLVHVPGTPDNYAVIEVKTSNAEADAIIEDIDHLAVFRTKIECRYERAMLLIFGEQAVRSFEDIQTYKPLCPIEIWIHEAHGQPAHLVHTLVPAAVQ